MKKRIAYSLHLKPENSLAIKILTGEKEPYHVGWICQFATADEELPPRVREMARPRRRLVQTLPNETVSQLTTPMPNLKSRLMTAAIQGVIAKEKGGRREEWVVDYKTLPKRRPADGQRGQNPVSAVFAKLSSVNEQYAAAQALGCSPTGMLPGYLALKHLFFRHGPAADTEEDAWNLVFLGKKERFLCVGNSDSLLFSRPLPEDLSAGEEKDEYITRLATEIDRSNFFAHQAERSMQVKRVIVCGDPDMAEQLVGNLSERSDLEVVHWRAEDLFTANNEEQLWPFLLDLAAAVAAYHGPHYKLLPPGAVRGTGENARRYAIVAVAAFYAGIVPILLIGGLWTTRSQDGFLREAAIHSSNLYKRAEDAAASYLLNRVFITRQENVDDLGRGQPDLAVLFNDIADRTPEDVIYSRLSVVRGRRDRLQLVLRGESIARDGERAQRTFLQFLDSMNTCPHLREIKEPVYLEITGVDDSTLPRSRVVFTLEYLIEKDREG